MANSSPTFAAPSTYLTCSTQQLLEAIGVLASNVTVPYKNANRTGIFNNGANSLAFPDNAANQLIGSQVYIDCDNTVPNNIVVASSYPSGFASNAPVPSDGPFTAGTSNLTTLQLMECLAVLLRELVQPYPFANQTGLFKNQANQYQFPDTAYNQNVGFNLNPYTDGVFIYIPTFVGWPSSGN